MIEGIKEIGEYSLEKKGKNINNPLSILVDDPANRFTKNILFIALESENNEFIYKGIEIEEYSRDKINKYLYKKGAPNGTDITPTSMITTVESTFSKIKILPWFKKHDKLGLNEDINFLVKIGDCIRRNKGIILADLNEKYKKENNVISLKMDSKYVGDYKIFQDILVDRATENLYSKYGKVSKAENKICSVCNQRRAEVYGFVDTYKFYTVDKPGFVSGGFHQEDAWKNYPVCLNCALTLESGKKYLGNNMNFNFYGFSYLLIPKFINSIDKEIRKEIFKIIEKQQDPKFRRKEINRLTSAENEILELMSEQNNYLNLNFMFYDAPKGSVFNILLYIEDILPSRLKTLFDVKKDVDVIDIFKECMIPVFENKKKTGEKPLEFNFGILRDLFYDFTNKRWISRKYFLDIVNKIFTNKPIDYNFIMNFIIQKIRSDFISGNPTGISTLKGFMLLNYLNKLKILKDFKGVRDMDENEMGIVDVFGGLRKKINSFFSEFVDFFDSNTKKAVFLEGVLVQKLLNIQRLPDVSNAQPGREPFRSRLKGLKLDEKQVKKLLPEIQNKLEEYGKNYYKELEAMISGYSVAAGNGWKIGNDEISYYFVLGMNLSYLFKTDDKEKEGKEDE